MKKKLLSFLAAVAITLALSGCGTQAVQNSSQLPAAPAVSAETQPQQTPTTELPASDESVDESTSSVPVTDAAPEVNLPTTPEIEDEQTPATRPPQPPTNHESVIPEASNEPASAEVTVMKVRIGSSTFTATLEDNGAVDALVELLQSAPLAISMHDYSGFEKVGSLPAALPASNAQTTTSAGDIVLYNGNQIVIFYGSNSWSYTRLGRIDDLTGWNEALGSGDVTVTFSVE